MKKVEDFMKRKICRETALFLVCLSTLTDLFDQTYEALKEFYGEKTAESMINGNVYNTWEGMEKLLYEHLNASISPRIADDEREEI